jgi:hypothetical protein
LIIVTSTQCNYCAGLVTMIFVLRLTTYTTG